MLTQEHRAYLEGRGYTPELLEEDNPYSVVGQVRQLGQLLDHPDGAVAWNTYSAAGTPMGVLCREVNIKKYRWAQCDNVEHIPMIYGSEKDYDLLWKTKTIVLAEGIMDRVALKRLWPHEAPIFARLTKGVGKQLLTFLDRYAETTITVFDNDDPGRTATQRTELKRPGTQSLLLPAKDPSKFLADYGLLKARALVRKRVELLSDI